MKQITIETTKKNELIDITLSINQILKASSIKEGMCIIYSPHTTSAITINESHDPDVKTDIINHLNNLIPYNPNYQHGEGNSDAHIKSSIIGNSRTILVFNNELILGQWEGVYFCEFDGPRQRKVYIKII